MVRSLAAAFVCTAVLVACSSGSSASSGPASDPSATYSAQTASTDLYVKAPQRYLIGIFRSSDQGVQLVTSGTIDVRVAPFQGGSGAPFEGKATYLGAPGTEADTGTAHLSDPSVARGVYELDGRFDAVGVWQADVTFSIDGAPVSLATQFQVAARPELPAPGQRALPTKNLTMTSDVQPESIDSRAQGDTPVPDPELHRDTIAGAIAAHRAALVLFATPVYCQSQFCGPSVDALERMSKTGPKDADYIHIEIYEDFAKNQVNEAARDWVIRPNAASDPWLFLIGPDGRIVDRWAELFDPNQVMAELRRVAG